MLPYKLVYHDRYDLNLGAHVFPSQKYRLIYQTLLREGLASPDDFLTPEPARDEDILLVHTPEYVRKLKTNTLSLSELMRLEIPYSKELIEACWMGAGGTMLAARQALQDGVGATIGGGLSPRLSRPRRGLLRDPRRGRSHPTIAKRRRHQNRNGCGY